MNLKRKTYGHVSLISQFRQVAFADLPRTSALQSKVFDMRENLFLGPSRQFLNRFCRSVVSFSLKILNFSDNICYTTYTEHCDDIHDHTCRAVVSKNEVRKCFNVTETVCALKEEVSYEIIDAVITVQKCRRVPGKLLYF